MNEALDKIATSVSRARAQVAFIRDNSKQGYVVVASTQYAYAALVLADAKLEPIDKPSPAILQAHKDAGHDPRNASWWQCDLEEAARCLGIK